MKKWNLMLVFCGLSMMLPAQSVWQALSPPVREWSQVAVAGPDVIYAVNSIWSTDSETMLARSGDGGATWDSVNTYYFYPFGLEFWDENNGYLLGGIPSCGLYAGMGNITNGGQNLLGRDYFYEFSSTNTANVQTMAGSFGEIYLAGNGPKVYHSSDTGATLVPVLAVEDDNNIVMLSDVDFVGSAGLICGSRSYYNPTIANYDYTGLIYRTENGAATWVLDSFPGMSFLFLKRVNTQTVFALSKSHILRSNNGGQTWETEVLPFEAINFEAIDAGHLFAVDVEGGVWESLNAGAAWTLSLEGHVIRDIQCAHNQCVVAGDMGAMFKTSFVPSNQISGNSDLVEGLEFQVWPNPTADYLTFTSTSAALFDYRLTDMSGKIVGEGRVQNSGRIDVRYLPSANFVITVQGIGSQIIDVKH